MKWRLYLRVDAVTHDELVDRRAKVVSSDQNQKTRLAQHVFADHSNQYQPHTIVSSASVGKKAIGICWKKSFIRLSKVRNNLSSLQWHWLQLLKFVVVTHLHDFVFAFDATGIFLTIRIFHFFHHSTISFLPEEAILHKL